MEYILLILGFVFLVKGADLFVEGSSNLAKFLKVPTLIIGLTIVAFGTSAPEAAVSITAALNGNNAISIGNVIGSNICNLLLVLGVSALYNPLKATKKVVERDYLFSIFASCILLVMVAEEFLMGEKFSLLSRSEGIILLSLLGVYLYSLLIDAFSQKKKLEIEKRKFTFRDLISIIIGIVGILIGGNLVVNSSVQIAEAYHISEELIALTIVAIGTSLPELVTSAVAAKKGETDIAIGNVIGSNIFNIFLILGASATILPLTIEVSALIDIIVMTSAQILVYLLMLKKMRIGYKKGIFMLLLYFGYMVYIIGR
ncbi:MAG: calcium/sodium antiporter [Bacilli bacterium]|nr:calcium/sodium antiporter [Bacilli bacterium]